MAKPTNECQLKNMGGCSANYAAKCDQNCNYKVKEGK